MSILSCTPNQALADFLKGVHRDTDTYRIALYAEGATLGTDTAVYTVSGEVPSSGGYTAGGLDLSGYVSGLSPTGGRASFDSPVWPNSTISARGAVIYNVSKANKVMAVMDFGATVSSVNGNFTVVLPSLSNGGVVQLNQP